jgi:hypothetical protein
MGCVRGRGDPLNGNSIQRFCHRRDCGGGRRSCVRVGCDPHGGPGARRPSRRPGWSRRRPSWPERGSGRRGGPHSPQQLGQPPQLERRLGSAEHGELQDHGAAPGPFYQLGAIGAVPPGQTVVVENCPAGSPKDCGEIPYLPAAAEQKRKNYVNRLTEDPEVKCYLPGIPRATYVGYPFQIVQSPKNILMAYEYASANRVVNMEKPTEAPVDSWMGWSNGKWEGDTLVVDVKSLNGKAWLDRVGDYTTDNAHIVERFTLTDADHINYEATIEDNKVFSRPWKISMPLYKRVEKNAQLLEFKCVEFAEEMLYGHLRKGAVK